MDHFTSPLVRSCSSCAISVFWKREREREAQTICSPISSFFCHFNSSLGQLALSLKHPMRIAWCKNIKFLAEFQGFLFSELEMARISIRAIGRKKKCQLATFLWIQKRKTTTKRTTKIQPAIYFSIHKFKRAHCCTTHQALFKPHGFGRVF